MQPFDAVLAPTCPRSRAFGRHFRPARHRSNARVRPKCEYAPWGQIWLHGAHARLRNDAGAPDRVRAADEGIYGLASRLVG